MVHRPAPQKHLATFPSLRPSHVTCHLNVHISLVAKQGMGAPVSQQRLRPDISVRVRQPNRVLAKVNSAPQPPWQHSARALERGIVEDRPRQPPRLSVVRQLDALIRTGAWIPRRIDARHHLVPTARSRGDEPKRGRIVDPDALIEKFLTGEAKRNDAPAMLGLDLHLPNAT